MPSMALHLQLESIKVSQFFWQLNNIVRRKAFIPTRSIPLFLNILNRYLNLLGVTNTAMRLVLQTVNMFCGFADLMMLIRTVGMQARSVNGYVPIRYLRNAINSDEYWIFKLTSLLLCEPVGATRPTIKRFTSCTMRFPVNPLTRTGRVPRDGETSVTGVRATRSCLIAQYPER